MKRALITGIEGQDGYYLSKLLKEKDYQVFGICRKKATHDINGSNTSEYYEKIYADMCDFTSLYTCINEVMPDEIYNLAGLSEIPLSWKQPVLTADVNGLGVLRLLEAVRLSVPNARFIQSSTSEIFDFIDEPLTENSSFAPRNPYGSAKLFAHWITTNYRESYNMYACSAILFNHESPRRGIEFVTRKISIAVAKIFFGLQDVLELGNLDAVRDWGSADDYVFAMWLMLQQDIPSDYIVATGKGHTVRDFVTCAFKAVDIDIEWKGHGFDEIAINVKTGKTVVRVNPKFYRYPSKDIIVGNPEKINKELGFFPQKSFEDMVNEIVSNDLNLLLRGLK